MTIRVGVTSVSPTVITSLGRNIPNERVFRLTNGGETFNQFHVLVHVMSDTSRLGYEAIYNIYIPRTNGIIRNVAPP